MAQNDGEISGLEDFDLVDLPEDQRKAFLEAIREGKETVELPAVAAPQENPATPPEPAKTDPPKVDPPAADQVKKEPEAPAKPDRPKTLPEALDRLNTEKQKREARERLLNRLVVDPEFLKEYLAERGVKVQIGQDAVAVARAVEDREHLATSVAEVRQAEIRQATKEALTYADTVLSGYDLGTTDGFLAEDAKWQAVWQEIGQDPEKAAKYVSDPEYRKTIKAQGPSDLQKYFSTQRAVREWMDGKGTKPLEKYLEFHDIARKASAPNPPAPAAAATPNPEFLEAQRLMQKQSEQTTMPNGTVQTPQGNGVNGIEELLAKADEIGTDNLTPEERKKIRTYYENSR